MRIALAREPGAERDVSPLELFFRRVGVVEFSGRLV
jgi:hypothetical protein